MAQRQLSRTLPKNFTFSLDNEPRTPERRNTIVDVPPPPRHSIHSCRLPRTRARAGTNVCARVDMDIFQFQGSDVPLPSIEFPQTTSDFKAPLPGDALNDEGLLAPPRSRMEFKTPPAQIRGTPLDTGDTESKWPSWDQTPGPHAIKRPGSACSSMSNSSIESIETFASRPSVGSCTSVESDLFDSYFPLEIPKEPEIESPSRPQKQHVKLKKVEYSWTREMDNHLWNTYQIYLQDPTMTPFKMTPGSIPPLGVTSRVARRAKKTWDKKRSRLGQSVSMTSVENTLGASTPKAHTEGSQPLWPKSDSKTRRRLKLLCRRKFSISPHYQRIMQSRTPEPATGITEIYGPPVDSRVQDFANNSAYATRDLGVSLVSSQPTPLAQVTQDAPSTTDWFNNPVPDNVPAAAAKTPVHHLRVGSAPSIPRLGSPFVYNTWAPGRSNRHAHGLNPPRRETIHAPAGRARCNTYMDQSIQDPNDVFARTPQMNTNPSEEEVDRRLEDYVRDNKFQNMGHGRVRVRNRGATTGAVNPRDMDQLFSPPSSLNSGPIEPEETTPLGKPNNPLLDLGENIKRLGSPFRIEGGFKRREPLSRPAPALSDPFSSGGPSYVAPHDAASPMHVSPAQIHEKASSLPYNANEDGLSDAERIRRQILNMPFTRN
ncbi:unnamed protein product [Penicillium olsonii]|uniref:Uncharacterized protein n=1 Tax=Penicillium olsonii TaxID=99116 RepID=A0A9W4HP55_PENOL|nr:unnamed protein product [Penicillium olsonii]CAG8075060.1 unnamed protein product [Penicillium olsonii]